MTTIAICNNKGGTGKTKTAQYLATALHVKGVSDVAVMDLDGQANLTDAMLDTKPGSRPAPSMADVLAQKATIADIVQWPIDPAIWVMPADGTLDDMADDLITIPLGVLRLKNALERERGRFQILLIDCPPNVGSLTFSALIAADYVIIPSAPAPWSINGVRRVSEKIEEIRATLGSGPKILGTIATMVRPTAEHTAGVKALEAPGMPRLLGMIPVRGGIDAATDLLTNYLRVAGVVLGLIGGDREQIA